MNNLVRDCIRPYRFPIALIAVITIAEVVLQIIIVNSVKPVIAESLNLNDMETLITTGGILLSLIALYAVAAISISVISSNVSRKLADKFRTELYAKILSLRTVKVLNTNSSGLVTNLVSDITNIQIFITELFRAGLYFPILTVAIIINAYFISPLVSVSLLVCFIAGVAIIAVGSLHRKNEKTEIQSLVDKTVDGVRDLVSSIRTVRAFRRWDRDYESYEENSRKLGKHASDFAVRVNYIASMFTVVTGMVLLVFFVLLMSSVDEYAISTTVMVLVVQLVILFISCGGMGRFFLSVTPGVRASLDRLEEVLNAASEEHPESTEMSEDDDMIIRYPEIDLSIPRHRETMLIGRLGSGKSTVVKTIMRLGDIHPGMVFFNGKDIAEIDPAFLRDRIAYAGDFALTFGGTVRENIDVWRGRSEEELKRVCETVFISPSELDDDLRQRNGHLSLNSRRKISIARALLSDADLYIFDDCFNGFNRKVQIALIERIRTFLAGKTVVFVQQNALCTEKADHIAFIDKRTIIASGVHESLMTDCPLYAEMYSFGGAR